MTAMILRVNVSGQAMDWIDWQEAVLLYAKDQVAWTLGDSPVRYYGGMNRVRKLRSYVDVHSIVAAKGVIGRTQYKAIPSLTNRELFRRDRHTCMYCLTIMADRHLTRDHIIPLSRGGVDEWTNVVTACKACNGRKADKLLPDIRMRLHAIPYTPNHAQWLILRNRNIRADQMSFLKTQCPKERREIFIT
ncbi:HNH endonuclease family protein [hydrothermal vent metagenome]|uniref:HNH endonuclease family protein n=1 Tax=hydrothermal vent metagenome TaxID=652676 RepID=A0A3B0ZCA7_9ZZZZ